MAIVINVIESSKQLIAGIPDYLSINIANVSNAIVYYTIDGSTPDIGGFSLTTIVMEHAPGDPLNGTIFLPSNANFLELNMVAVGTVPGDTATFNRRYGLDTRKIGIGRPGIKKNVDGGSSYTNTVSPNIANDGQIIANDGYTQGTVVNYNITAIGFDGYNDGYSVATSGTQVAIPPIVYDHVYGYTDYTNADGYSTTTLTPEQELELVRLSNRGSIFIAMPDENSSTNSILISKDDLINIDPRSSTIIDSDGDQIEVIPKQEYPAGYTEDIGANTITDDFDNGPSPENTIFTSSGIFDPRAAYMEIDGRIDGYINGQPITPGDRTIINKPYGELRYPTKKEDLGDAVRKTMGYVSGGLVCPIYDYNKGQAAFYYWDAHDNKWVVSLQKIEAPKYEIIARRNGVVVGQVFRWVTNKRQVLPG